MTSTDFHLRRLIDLAAEERSHRLVDDAFAIIEGHLDCFSGEFSPELLVEFAEVASDLRERETAVFRALDLHSRLRCEDDQFKVRALLVRCVYEARLGSETLHLKGLHLLQQLKYALGFLTQALGVATRPGGPDARYGFLVYNASRVFWDVVRPVCRQGWQRHIVQEGTTILEALKAVRPGGADPKAKGGGGGPPGGAAIPVTVDLTAWLVELALNVAFGLEDAEKNADAQKMAEYALTLAEEAKDPKLKNLVLSARAYLARKVPGKTKEDIDKASGSTVMGTALFVCNGGIPKELAEDQLINAWKSIDAEFDLRAAKEALASGVPAAPEKGSTRAFKPQQLLDLASALRAACSAGCWGIAQPMLDRIEKFQVPAGRGRLLVDLARAEIEVWRACNVKQEDPVSKLLLSKQQQQQRELEMRHRAVRLCEQCIATAKRIDEIDLVEESAVVMWNIARELACAEHRHRIHKSLAKCAEILEEIGSVSLVQLRVHLHYEVALCEITQDLLTKGKAELHNAEALDYTVPQSDLLAAVQQQIGEEDPGPYLRPMDASIDQQLHLLHWKLNVYEEPSEAADQVMLLLDQVQRPSTSSGKLASNLLVQGFAKLEAALEDLVGEKIQSLSNVFQPPPRVVTSDKALQPLPHQAPATVKEGGARADEIAALVPQPIKDQKPKSEREAGVAKAKRIIMLMCKIGLEAKRVNEQELAIKACSRAMDVADVAFGPPPIEVEGALLLAEAAYTKAQCLAKQLEALGVMAGVDDTKEEAQEEEEPELDMDGEENEPTELTPEEKAAAVAKKKELIKSLLYGMAKSHEFKQWGMVANGLSHWWNLHLDLVSLSHEKPELLDRSLQEYQEGLKTIQKYLCGDSPLPSAELNHPMAANIALANINVGVQTGQLTVLDVDQLMVLKRLGEHERKNIVACVTGLCKTKEKPLPDLARLRPERLEAAPPAAGGGKDKKGAPAAVTTEDKSDLQGNEADIIMATVSVPFAKDSAEAVKLVDQAVQLLNKWQPKANDEPMQTLWVELWTRLGRQCLGKPMHANEGAKYALMCAIKGLGQVDAPIPKYASKDRLQWRGACHALCGEVFMQLVDPHKQEKESLNKLRKMSVEQFERCCDYAVTTCNPSLAVNGASNMWNVSLPLMNSAETRQVLIQPLTKATRALAAVKYSEDPFFFAGLYRALFDCYSDASQWDKIHEMLNEAFQAIPANNQRKLWALRMLALSRQGKNVGLAMGKMKESQAKAQAGIWLVLAGASSKPSDQLNAFTKAIEILQNAEQPEVVEVRLQFADWLLRNRFDPADAREQLEAAADLLLLVEEEDEEDEDEEADEDQMYSGNMDDQISEDKSASDGRSFTGGSQAGSKRSSRRGSQMGASDIGRS
eukprot:CAMPEP_0203912188 /NCGR_PEP_ID=MMETSP0359-20131031/53276_1 /ASSEMBLY_ACC=CAM_ASM_000338 /TAXON_ID=268821 /ORGANISM="Scrippsiella Hangoei, Strain SHTV-5" /LENGTH=1376 /DNA_ID=CAMNT_0050838069 /DNA_START=64 /DNA_END=4190 /DNA_ORIENTATION=+